MGLTASAKGKTMELIPAGSHQAICYGVVDLGKQYNQKFDSWKDKCLIFWELPDERMHTEEGEKPRVISNQYTTSLNEKSLLTAHLESWRGKKFTEEEKRGFNIANLIGANCILSVVHNGDYANVSGVSPLMKGMAKKVAESPTLLYDIDKDGTNIPDGVYDWVKDIIKKSEQFTDSEKHHYTQAEPEFPDDDIPF